MGNNDLHQFVCVQCGKITALFSDATIKQKDLDKKYRVEKAKILLNKQ